MRNSLTTKVIDKGAKHIIKQFEVLTKKGNFVTIGVHKDIKYPDSTPVAQVAFWLHEGTRTMKERPFIRRVIVANKKEYFEKEKQIISDVLQGKDAEFLLNSMGFLVEVDVAGSISNAPNWASKLSDFTLARKTGSLLFESGTLFRSIGYQVTQNGKEKPVKRSER